MERFLRLRQVLERTGFSRAQLYRLMALDRREGGFPRNVSLSPGNGRSVAWIESEVAAWIEQRIAASRERQAETIAGAR